MHRRIYLLTLSSLLGLAGCQSQAGDEGGDGAGSSFELEMSKYNSTEIAKEYAYNIRGNAVTDEEREVFVEAINNGSATYTTTSSPIISPRETPRVVRYNGAVYILSSKMVEKSTVEKYRYTIEVDSADTKSPSAETIAFDSLPEVDRSKLAAHGLANVSGEKTFGIGFPVVYTPAEHNRSVLVPEPEKPVLGWSSEQFARINIADAEKISAKKYQYTADRRGSLAEFGRKFKREHTFNLTGLSEPATEIVEKAINRKAGYETDPVDTPEGVTPPSGTAELVNIFSAHSDKGFGKWGSKSGSDPPSYYLVRFKGQTYRVQLSYKDEIYREDS